MAGIQFRNVSKSFGTSKIIDNLDLTIEDGKFTVLVGASGCGKTTLLRMIAGIGPATSGHIFMDDKEITDVDPGKRDIAMVFQNYAIYPTMTVRENIEFGLKNNRVPKDERARRIREVAASVGLSEYLDRKPSTLSGGQRQRIALARAMVKKPKVFLMDEPLSNLDAKLRIQMRVELIELQKQLKTTFVYVTHDQVEAMSMADTIVLMDKGIIQQVASPHVIYNDPNSVYIAQFIGSPSMNILPLKNGMQFGFRPEKAVMKTDGVTSGHLRRKGTILTREMLGSETIYKVQLACGAVMVKSLSDDHAEGDAVTLNIAAEHLYFFGEDGKRIRRADTDQYDQLLALSEGMNDA